MSQKANEFMKITIFDSIKKYYSRKWNISFFKKKGKGKEKKGLIITAVIMEMFTVF